MICDNCNPCKEHGCNEHEAVTGSYHPPVPKPVYTDEQLRFEVLNLPEWYQPMSNSSGSCPWCENMQHWGHAKDCPRALVLEILEAVLS